MTIHHLINIMKYTWDNKYWQEAITGSPWLTTIKNYVLNHELPSPMANVFWEKNRLIRIIVLEMDILI